MNRYLLFLLLLLTPTVLAAQTAQGTPPPAETMRPYWFALLKKGPNRDQPEAERAAIMKGHFENMNRMVEAGKLVLAGPFTDPESDWQGMYIFMVDTREEAEALASSDPAVKAGRLIVELHPWYGPRGYCFPK